MRTTFAHSAAVPARCWAAIGSSTRPQPCTQGECQLPRQPGNEASWRDDEGECGLLKTSQPKPLSTSGTARSVIRSTAEQRWLATCPGHARLPAVERAECQAVSPDFCVISGECGRHPGGAAAEGRSRTPELELAGARLAAPRAPLLNQFTLDSCRGPACTLTASLEVGAC